MDFPYLAVQVLIVTVQSCFCCMHGCRTSNKIEELDKKIQKLKNQTAFYFKRVMARKDDYKPPDLMTKQTSSPEPSAPFSSDPEVYKLDIIY